jgi:hypothetical protein
MMFGDVHTNTDGEIHVDVWSDDDVGIFCRPDMRIMKVHITLS